MEIRPEVMRFAEMMERKLQLHDSDRGDEWRDFTAEYLLFRMKDEMRELVEAITNNMDRSTICCEAADVGNFCMMISESYGQ